MDLTNVLEELYARKSAVERAIADLESIVNSPFYGTVFPQRRGRSGMGEAERGDVSRRMKKYWADWRSSHTKPEISLIGKPARPGKIPSSGDGLGDRPKSYQRLAHGVERLEDAAHLHSANTAAVQDNVQAKNSHPVDELHLIAQNE